MDKDFTIVTALLDIKRGEWNDVFTRKFIQYKYYFSLILNLNCNFIIFIDKNHIDWLNNIIKQKNNKIIIQPITINDLDNYKNYEKIKYIMNCEHFKKDLVEKNCPEFSKPEYNIITNSKIYFIKKARELSIQKNINYSHYIWIDAGYGHGEIQIPKNWYPKNLLENDKITLLAIKNPQILLKYNNFKQNKYLKLHKDHIDILIGGIFSIPNNLVEKYNKIYYDLLKKTLDMNITDDDQYITCLCYLENKELFTVYINNDWFSAFKIFK